MAKISGKYEQPFTEELRKQITEEDSRSKRLYLISKYLHQRGKQIEKVLANIENDDIDFAMVIEQLWQDLQLALTTIRSYKKNIEEQNYELRTNV